MKPAPWIVLVLIALAAVAMAACSAGDASDAGIDGEENDERECHDARDNDDDGWVDCADTSCFPIPSCRVDGGQRDGGFEACSGELYPAREAFAPVDIIWIVDTSGSMSDEAERVQQNMQRFATAIGAVGIDWRVVMISSQAFVNVPAELASDPRYLLIDREVNSTESLRALLVEFPRYQPVLRRSALTHFVVVTDDESDLEWESFLADMQRNLMRNFVFHAIASEDVGSGGFFGNGACEIEGGGFPPEGASAPGVEYYELAAATGGRTFSICTPAEEWVGLFDTLTAAIAQPVQIPCEYDVPVPDDGTELDTNFVNVTYEAGSGGTLRFPYVGGDDGADCTDGGWYFDDPDAPTRIQLCPSTCSMVSGDTEGRINVELGCSTFII